MSLSRHHLPPSVLLVAVFAVGVAACGDETRPRADGSDTPETADTADGEALPDELDSEQPEDVAEDVADSTADSFEDTADDAHETAEDTAADSADVTAACPDHFACNAPLDPEGRCPGTCFPTDDTLRCDGVVVDAVCHTLEPATFPEGPVDFGDFTVTPVAVPTDARVGETYDLALRLDNDTDRRLELPFRWKTPGTWTIASPSWADVTAISLDAHGSLSLTATITAAQVTVLSGGPGIIFTMIFGEDQVYEPHATVHFGETEAIACGGEHFPESYCPGDGCYESRNFYTSARCCDDVFFPGALCCDDGDCTGGACVDGRCVFSAPSFGTANNVPLGHQRIRLVLVDSHPQFTDPCADHYEDVKDELDLASVEGWYDDLARRRLGRDAADFRWIVTGGVATSDFLTGPAYWDNFGRELDAFLADRGCPIFDAYDKVIVSASTVDLMNFGGIYFDRGNIAVISPNNPYLLAHELAHSFGASDLYLDLAGTFLYPRDLMGNSLSAPPLPGDKVAWGEMGFGDVDRNGVVDLVEMAAFPEALAVAHASATITAKNSIEIRWEFVGVEDGVDKQLVLPLFHVRVPAANVDSDQNNAGRWKSLTFDQTQVDLAAIEAAGVIEVGIAASYRFTDRDWTPRTLRLDTTLEVPVTREPAR